MLYFFYSEEVEDILVAKSICAACAVSTPCLEWAVAHKEPNGVWGGQYFLDGRITLRKATPGRRPSVPDSVRREIEISIDEIPVHLRHRTRYSKSQFHPPNQGDVHGSRTA